MLYDRGDCVGAAASQQAALVAGHPRVAVLAGGVAAWPGELGAGRGRAAEDQDSARAAASRPCRPGRSCASGSTIPELTILDVRSEDEFHGRGGYPCDPRQGHIPGARHLEVERLFAGPGRPHAPWEIRELTGLPEGAEIVAYCHSGSRSALAALALRAAGYRRAQLPRARGTSGRATTTCRRSAERGLRDEGPARAKRTSASSSASA